MKQFYFLFILLIPYTLPIFSAEPAPTLSNEEKSIIKQANRIRKKQALFTLFGSEQKNVRICRFIDAFFMHAIIKDRKNTEECTFYWSPTPIDMARTEQLAPYFMREYEKVFEVNTTLEEEDDETNPFTNIETFISEESQLLSETQVVMNTAKQHNQAVLQIAPENHPLAGKNPFYDENEME